MGTSRRFSKRIGFPVTRCGLEVRESVTDTPPAVRSILTPYGRPAKSAISSKVCSKNSSGVASLSR